MTLRKLLKIVSGLLVLFAVAVGLTSINHPIILKWVTGSARHFGKPIPATVYTNGQPNGDFKVFYTDEANNYLLSVTDNISPETSTFFNLNLNEKWIGGSDGTSKDDYDFIAGHLFQSTAAGIFLPYRNEIAGHHF